MAKYNKSIKTRINMLKRILVLFVLLTAFAFAQPTVKATFSTMDNWRGVEYTQNPVLYPSVVLPLADKVELSFNGTVALSDNHINDGIVTTVCYTPIHCLTLQLNDYYFLNYGFYANDFRNWNDGPGAHLMELQATYCYNWLDVTGAVNIYDDRANTTYFEVGVTPSTTYPVRVFIGGTLGNKDGYSPAYYTYNAKSFDYTNVGLSVAGPKVFNLPTKGIITYSNVTKNLYGIFQLTLL